MHTARGERLKAALYDSNGVRAPENEPVHVSKVKHNASRQQFAHRASVRGMPARQPPQGAKWLQRQSKSEI